MASRGNIKGNVCSLKAENAKKKLCKDMLLGDISKEEALGGLCLLGWSPKRAEEVVRGWLDREEEAKLVRSMWS